MCLILLIDDAEKGMGISESEKLKTAARLMAEETEEELELLSLDQVKCICLI